MRANVCSASRICTAARLDLRLKPRPILGPSSMRCWMTLMHCRVAGPPPLAACAGVVRKVRAEGGGGGGGDAKITYMGPPGGPTRCKSRERVRAAIYECLLNRDPTFPPRHHSENGFHEGSPIVVGIRKFSRSQSEMSCLQKCEWCEWTTAGYLTPGSCTLQNRIAGEGCPRLARAARPAA